MATWTKRTKPSTSWDKRIGYLLQEIGDFLLQENGDKIVINQSTTEYTNWTKRTIPS